MLRTNWLEGESMMKSNEETNRRSFLKVFA